VAKWGGPGSGNGQFNGPEGIAVDESGNIFVADRENNRIQKFTSNGAFLSKFGSLGMMDGQFNWPHGVAIDESGNIYVVDSNNYRIQKFTSAGAFILKWGQKGSQDGQFYNPTGIVVDKSGYVYVSDSGNHRIQKFTSEGVFVTKWGSLGSGMSQFDNPTCLAVDGSGSIFVVDNYNDYIQKFTSSGSFITKIGAPGFDDGQFDAPYGIAVTDSGYVYVSDLTIRRIQKFASNSQIIIPTKYTLTTFKTGEGSIVLDKTGPYDANTVVQLTAVANNGWSFSQWSGDASGTISTIRVLINSDKTVTAVFARVIIEDTSPPTVSLELPVNGGICWTGDVLVGGLYTDDIGISKESVNLSIDGVNVTSGIYVGKDLMMYQVSLPLGIHVAKLTVDDLGGNVATATTSFTVIPLVFLVIPVIIGVAVMVLLFFKMSRRAKCIARDATTPFTTGCLGL
jgi:DNA-binding beta-propeller fold protein YncE